ncbi:hypothetical protein M434DRAFT_380000 [Hypoxylon sp. CO27-5]|nr:hypothetical protein M434DRAFT_380000 [Hypoxylon sp. CO27-5]
MVVIILNVMCLGLTLCYGFPSEARPSRPSAIVNNTLVSGKTSRLPSAPHVMVDQFLGIPYAKSPPRRFEPPEDEYSFASPWDASYYRPSCFQYFANSEFEAIFNDPPLPESEDCLYLNIFTPSVASSEALPVLFWIHGGSFALGSARIPEYDGSSFAANQGIVVVTINYRTNVFGFPGSTDIPFERRNIGLLDQRKALSWVNDNIRAFGGDPSKITIFGESAGAWSVKQLLIHPPSPPQFRAAILQSQAFGPLTDNQESWNTSARALGCTDLNSSSSTLGCVTKAPAQSVRAVLHDQGLGFTPVVDNATNGPMFRDAVEENLVAQLPILIGTNANEGSILASVIPPSEVLLGGIFANDTDAMRLARSAYPINATDMELRSLITTDYTYTCTTSAIAHAAASNRQNVWRYYFNASFSNNQPIPRAGAFHTSEIPLVWLSESMQKAWGNFAKDPEVGPGWPAIGTSENDLRVF